MNPTVLFFVAAGSGGHINPAVTLAQNELQKDRHLAIHFFTGAKEMEVMLASKLSDATIHSCTLGQFNMRRWWQLPKLVTQICKLTYYGYAQAKKHKPHKVISTGSLLALPICFGAWLAGAQVFLYELNVEVGKAVQALSPLAKKIACCFDQTIKHPGWFCSFFKHKFEKTDYPLRFIPLQESQADSITKIAHNTGVPLSPDKKTVVVLGGSQGSLFLNQAVQEWASKKKLCNVQFIHQAGRGNTHELKQFYAAHKLVAYVFDYDHAVDLIYNAADIIVCRAGAGTLFEIVAHNKQAAVIPLLSTTTSHQYANAQAMATQYPSLIHIIHGSDAAAKKRALAQKLDTLSI